MVIWLNYQIQSLNMAIYHQFLWERKFLITSFWKLGNNALIKVLSQA